MADKQLNYRISNWDQASACLSNLSRDYYISVMDILDTKLKCKVIQVNHCKYGCMFAAFTDSPEGCIVSEDSYIMSNDDILKSLANFGFSIEYREEVDLSGDMMSYLMDISDLGFKRIAKVSILRPEERPVTIAFKPEYEHLLEDVMSTNAISDLVLSSYAVVLDNKYDWRWVTKPMDIDTILDNNGVIENIEPE